MALIWKWILTLACLIVGYGFYKINQGDAVNAVFFTIGILGLMASVMRNKNKPEN